MKITEITLAQPAPLYFCGRQIATVERHDLATRIDCLNLRFESGSSLLLPAAVDVSEQPRASRIFVMEGAPDHNFAIFGGEEIYWLSTNGIRGTKL
jgi:hypothetical protein